MTATGVNLIEGFADPRYPRKSAANILSQDDRNETVYLIQKFS